ncbi:hypothetical protein [Dactylosporangium sp. NPDC048998]|uniref:hypothetical protein n=1 Tax=Dactylosporangium sp. NPDC048998 TaxID=3363976 RepID=UPI0037212604
MSRLNAREFVAALLAGLLRPPRAVPPRAVLAAGRGWRYARSATSAGFGAVELRWRAAHAAGLADLDPAEEITGVLDGGPPFTAFDMRVMGARAPSRRTVSMVHLPAALPPVAVIPDPDNGEPCAEGRVGPVPPWAALGFQRPAELDAAPPPDHPGFAEALVTGEVLDLTRRLGLTGWRIAGPDLIWVSRPGPDGPLPAERLVAVLEGLGALAGALPPEVVARYA